MSSPHPLMEALLSQYRGELSALEAYDRALQKFADQPEEEVLTQLRADHVSAVRRLGSLIRRHGGVEPEGSGAWGTFAAALEGLASVVNDEAPLRLLHRGEARGLDAYAKMLEDPLLAPDVVGELQFLLDHSQSHMAALEALLEQLSAGPNRPLI